MYAKINPYMSEKQKKIWKTVGYLALFGYIIGALFLVIFLKKQAQDRLIDFAVANTMFDIYTFSLGVCLLVIMPFSINRNYDRVVLLSFIIFAVFLGLAIYFKYYAMDSEILADLLYVFSGALFYQGIKYSIKWKKYGKNHKDAEDME